MPRLPAPEPLRRCTADRKGRPDGATEAEAGPPDTVDVDPGSDQSEAVDERHGEEDDSGGPVRTRRLARLPGSPALLPVRPLAGTEQISRGHTSSDIINLRATTRSAARVYGLPDFALAPFPEPFDQMVAAHPRVSAFKRNSKFNCAFALGDRTTQLFRKIFSRTVIEAVRGAEAAIRHWIPLDGLKLPSFSENA